jgi:hypothetical protein
MTRVGSQRHSKKKEEKKEERKKERKKNLRTFDADDTMTLTGLCPFKCVVELHCQLHDFRLRIEAEENSALLGCYAASSGNS